MISQLRGTLADLTPADLGSVRLGEVLGDLAARLDTEGRLKVHVAPNSPVVGEPIGGVVFAIGREAITNAIRHSGAANLWITVARSPTRLTLRVEDDGVGFSAPDLYDSGHLGLRTMRSRAFELGGVCTISNDAVHGGTRVDVVIPVLAHPVTAATSN